MDRPPFKSVSYELLAQTGESTPGVVNTDFGAPGWLAYPMPPGTGSGGYESLDLAIGLTVVRSSFKFQPAMRGQWLSLMEVNVEFSEPSFQAMTLRGMRGSLEERYPAAKLALSPGVDLFRHTDKYCSIVTVDGGCSGEVHHVSIGRSKLDQLLGQEIAEQLLQQLDLTALPSVSAKPIPLHVSRLLGAAMTPTLAGSTRKLFCQAKVLEYLAAMAQYLCEEAALGAQQNPRSRDRSHALHAQLMACEGKLPTLDALAEQYGRSAKLLNEEFVAEFGQSIFAFVIEHRLMQAHTALTNSDISIKRLAAQFGYSHVSNFAIAFKRKFGYTPGSLRKK